jgi:hypothetical protein
MRALENQAIVAQDFMLLREFKIASNRMFRSN